MGTTPRNKPHTGTDNNRSSSFWAESKHIAFICGVCVLLIFFYGRIGYWKSIFRFWDQVHYRAMAEAAPGLPTDILQPFTYRILGPYLAGLLPVSDMLGFYILSIAASIVLAAGFYLFLRYVRINPQTATLTIVLFMLNWHFFGFTIWDYFQINDVLSMVYILVLMWAMFRQNWLVFGLMLSLGALTRETAFIMVPVAAVYLTEKKILKREALRYILSLVPGLLLLVIIRILIEPSGGEGPVAAFFKHGHKLKETGTWFDLLIRSVVPFSFIPFIFFGTTIEFLKDKKYLVAMFLLVLVSTFVASNNERLMAPTFIAFYWLLAYILQKDLKGKFIAAVLVITAVTACYYRLFGRYYLPPKDILENLQYIGLWSATIFVIAIRLVRLPYKKVLHE